MLSTLYAILYWIQDTATWLGVDGRDVIAVLIPALALGVLLGAILRVSIAIKNR